LDSCLTIRAERGGILLLGGGVKGGNPFLLFQEERGSHPCKKTLPELVGAQFMQTLSLNPTMIFFLMSLNNQEGKGRLPRRNSYCIAHRNDAYLYNIIAVMLYIATGIMAMKSTRWINTSRADCAS
jgi:hypothetical protein